MKHYYLAHKNRTNLFMFWLIQQLAPPGIDQKNKPVSNFEFLGTMAMIIIALAVLKIAFK